MTNSATNSLLNDLLIQVHRSLLQYAAESWPWSAAADSEVQRQVVELAHQQEQTVRKLVGALAARQSRIDFGVYPPEYTSLHFVSLDYFLKRLRESEAAVLSDINAIVSQLASESDAAELAQSVLATQQQIVDGLKNLHSHPAVI